MTAPPPPHAPSPASAGTLRDRYEQVKDRIARAASRSGRTGTEVVLVAVSKYAEPDQIRELIQMGHRDFGESQVQQLLQRAAMIDEWLLRQRSMLGASRAAGLGRSPPTSPPHSPARSVPARTPNAASRGADPAGPDAVRWHMVGHLQRNKARKVAEVCRLIHSVDSLRLAEEIQAVATRLQADAERRAGHGPAPRSDGSLPGTVDVLLQVNVAGEPSKHGCSVPAAIHLAEQIDTMVQIRLRGLMVMAPYSPNPEDARPTFAAARELFHEMAGAGIGGGPQGHFNILSMGMSGDFEVAIEEGANLVRVGSGIFGEPRPGSVDVADDTRE